MDFLLPKVFWALKAHGSNLHLKVELKRTSLKQREITHLFCFLVHSDHTLLGDTQQAGNQFILSWHFFLKKKIGKKFINRGLTELFLQHTSVLKIKSRSAITVYWSRPTYFDQEEGDSVSLQAATFLGVFSLCFKFMRALPFFVFLQTNTSV